jgi:hypothetical protein
VIEIKTKSELGSKVKIVLTFKNTQKEKSGGFYLHFDSTVKYYLASCSGRYADFSIAIPSSQDKIWTVMLNRVSGVRIVVRCNGVEVLSTLLSEANCKQDEWTTAWAKQVSTIQMKITPEGTSAFFRTYKGNSCQVNGHYNS